MTLLEAQEQLKKLENEYKFWLREKEIAKSIVTPKSMSVKQDVISGGKRIDKMLKYVEILEEKKINETLNYISLKQKNIMNFIEDELKIIGQYNEIEKKIYDLRQQKVYWWKIGNIIGLSERQCRRIYKKMIKK